MPSLAPGHLMVLGVCGDGGARGRAEKTAFPGRTLMHQLNVTSTYPNAIIDSKYR